MNLVGIPFPNSVTEFGSVTDKISLDRHVRNPSVKIIDGQGGLVSPPS